MKVLYILPHCSTGGMPQYVLKLIEHSYKEHDISVVETDNLSDDYVVQRNKIKQLVPFYQLHGDHSKLINLIQDFDIIHFQEIPETFLSDDILNKIYIQDRTYRIVVTTHSSYTNPADLRYTADKFILVSNWSKKIFEKEFPNICDIWEYPIENIEYDKDEAKQALGWDDEYKHVLHVGLFTPGKNQKEIIEIARLCQSDKIKFHFIGNQASNFQYYWEPLMSFLPSNCIIHGEVNNPEDYYKAADLFYFPSLFELNPLAVKEALSYNLPVLLRKLDTYENMYDGKVEYIDIKDNVNQLKKSLFRKPIDDMVVIVLAHADTDYRKELLKNCLKSITQKIILCANYPVDHYTQQLCDYVFYTKENPLLKQEDFEKYNVSYNYWWIDENGQKQYKPFEYEHGYAVYKLIQNGISIAKLLGYKYVSVINYDYEIGNLKLMADYNKLSNNHLLVYKQQSDAYKGFTYSTGYFLGKINVIDPFFNKYQSISEYYSDGENFNILEKKFYDHYKISNYKLVEEDIEFLKNDGKVNQEEVLLFSKSNDYKKHSFKELCNLFECDKGIHHSYDEVYENIISNYRDKEINIFEIGIDSGKSLKVWESYLPFAFIYGMDISQSFDVNKGKIFIGDQSNIEDLKKVVSQIPKCKLIVDDGSHNPEHQLKTFYYLFENLLDWNGVYVIEDIETSYWRPEVSLYGYETGYLNIVDYFTKLNHTVNAEFSQFKNKLHIKSITYYKNCIVIIKDKEGGLEKEYKFKSSL